MRIKITEDQENKLCNHLTRFFTLLKSNPIEIYFYNYEGITVECRECALSALTSIQDGPDNKTLVIIQIDKEKKVET